MLYAIQAGDDGPVKLGVAICPHARLRGLQTSHYARLHLRAMWPGDQRDEQVLHERFAPARLLGEWFAYTSELHAFVCERVAAAAQSQPQRLVHPTWREHAASDDGARRSADEWVAVLCDIAPRLTAEHLLAYVDLVACADPRGLLRVDLATLSDRVLGDRDRLRAAQLLDDLKELLLPDPDGPYEAGAATARLARHIVVRTPTPAQSDTDFVDALVTTGCASVGLHRYGAGFGRHALPASFPVRAHCGTRHAWACGQLKAAEIRLLERQAAAATLDRRGHA